MPEPTPARRGRPPGKAARDPELLAHVAHLRSSRTLREIAAASGVPYERLRNLVLSRTVATENERKALYSLA